MAEVVLDRVSKVYPGGVTAVKEMNLHIQHKEFIVLVGPSGCGKTTTLRMVAGLEEITDGTIRIGDRTVNDVPPKNRDVAMVFQNYALYPHMSVYDNMAFGLALRKTSKAEIARRVKEAAGILEIEGLLKRKPGQLSGGQRQRVALGRAIVREPAVFLLDEPLSNLDAKLRVQTRVELSRLHRRLETTFVYVTHDQVEAMTMASRIAVMDKGVLHQVGSPQELYQRPHNIFVAGFIGSPAMNFFEVSVNKADDRMQLESRDIALPVPPGKEGKFSRYTGRRMTIGIRPEDIHAREYLPPGIEGPAVFAQVDAAEMMGNELFLHFDMSGQRFLARVDARLSAIPGQLVAVVFNMEKVHGFDPATGNAV